MKRTLFIAVMVAAGALACAGCKGSGPERPDIQSVATAAPPAEVDAGPASGVTDVATQPSAASDAGTPEPAPDAGTVAVFPEDPFRADQPVPGPVPDLTLPSIERFTLPSGLEVFLVPETQLPTVFMSFEFDLAGVDDPPGQAGLASVCLDLYSEGTATLDKIAFAEEQADHAVSIWSPAGTELSTVNLKTLEGELGPALDLLAGLLKAPGMRQADFDRIIAKRKSDLAQERGTPDGVANRLFGTLVWGKQHPYGRLVTDADLDAITLTACKAWVKQLRPGGARLWVVGKVTRERLERELAERLAGWTGEAPRAHAIPAAAAPSGALAFVQIDGAAQSYVVVGAPGPRRDAPDYAATTLMAQILGGSFASRINMNLREDKGYAYGGFGGFDYHRAGSTLSVAASVETATTALALREIAKEIKGMREIGATDAELGREREGALLGLPARFATPTDTLSEFKRLAFYGLPLDWFTGYQQQLRAVDLAAVNAAAKAHLLAGDVDVLVVGDGAAKAKGADDTVLDELRKVAAEKHFGGGGLVVLDADGRPAAQKPGAAAAPHGGK